MASKRNQQGDSNSETNTDVNAATSAYAEMARQQMAVAADAMSMMFRAGETLQHAQLQMGQRAALLHSQAADNLRKATSPTELMTIQSTLILYQFQEAMRYWQDLLLAGAKIGEAGRQAQADTLSAAPGSSADGSAATSAAATMMGAAINAAAPMAEAMQQMFSAPLKAASSPPTAH
jgi:hypothetical protein